MYNIEIKQAEKIFLINVSGFIKMDEALNFMKDLKKNMASIPNITEHHLIINAKDQKTVSPDVQEVLSEAISIYTNTPFKSHHSVVLDSVTTKSQILRLGSTNITSQFQFHDTLEEAINSCK